MPVPRKLPQWSIRQDRSNKMNGLYVHASPPRVLSINSAHLKQIVRSGDVERLQALVYDGQGKKLLGESSNDPKVKHLLQNIPALMSKISLLHDAVNSGRLNELQAILEEETEKTRKRLIAAKDDAGVGLLHKAIYYDLKPIAEWIIKTYPNVVQIKDAEGRTPYHYTPMGANLGAMQKLLKMAGADPSALDNRQRSVKYYKDHIAELELPSAHKSSFSSRRGTAVSDSLNIKKSNIRIWIHQRDLNNLQHVIWEGHGSKLLVEHSNNPKVKRFLEACPYMMGCVKDLHSDVINGDFEAFKEHSNPPVPNVLYIAKDCNGLTPLHKAVGLGRHEMVAYIIAHNPKSLSCVDNEGRTALHYSPILKDGGKMFDYLVEAGADEGALDNKSKSAGFYKMHTNEIDAKLLLVIPDSPRKAKEVSNFDWSILGVAATPLEEMAKVIASSAEDHDSGGNVAQNGGAEVNNNEEHSEEGETTEETQQVDAQPDPTQDEAVLNPALGEGVSPMKLESDLKLQTGSDPGTEADLVSANEVEAGVTAELENRSDTEPEPEREPTPEPSRMSPTEATPEPDMEREVTPTPPSVEPATDSQPESEENPEEVSRGGDTPVESDRETAILEPEAVIEGVVNGENEVESVNEQGATKEERNEAEISAMVSSGNMEHLAALVLDGDGDRLMGQASEVPELQSFLENVPVYMNKINRIHMAAREGNLKDLQAALDRRKFAIAKDKISANGTSPLHVATIFGNTSIVRYLAGRFPETVNVTDANGRTPLHYAAVVPDNGHYYNLLVHLGANARAEDKFGHTPDFYRSNQGSFSHRSILADFGAEELADEMLSDKVPDDVHSARKGLDPGDDMLGVLERCFVVLQGRHPSNATSATSTLSVGALAAPSAALTKHTRRYVFDAIKTRLTRLDHNLYDVIWPSVKKLPTDAAFRANLDADFPAGVVVPDFDAFHVFAELLLPVIKDCHNLDPTLALLPHPESMFANARDAHGKLLDIDVDLDTTCKSILSGSTECTRNMASFELPNYLSVGDLEAVERMVTSALLDNDVATALYPNATAEEIADKGSGMYYTMNEILEEPSEARMVLASNGLLIPLWTVPDSERLHGQHWPYGRGVFITNSFNLAVWINVLDHIRIVTVTSTLRPGNIGQAYTRLYKLMHCLNQRLQFRRHEQLGFLSARPTAVGSTLHFNLNIRFPQLIKEPENFRYLCSVRGLSMHRAFASSDIVRIRNRQSLGITELQCFEDFCRAVANILQLEKDMAVSNSLHIATMLVNIFKKKRHSVTDG